jgi:hypothetical protein
MRGSIRWIGGILALWLLISSCGPLSTTAAGDTRTDTQAVELGSANAVKVQILMGAGELSVAGDAASLMDATFRYNVADWQPRVNYAVNGGQGELRVDHQDDDPAIPIGRAVVNEWDLLLTNGVPIDLEVQTGAGVSALDLRGLDLTGLRIDVGAGTTSVDLSGALVHDLNAIINGGFGELSVRLPAETGVRVSVDTGIGALAKAGLVKDGDAYVNEAYGKAPHTLFLEIHTGVGAIELLAP